MAAAARYVARGPRMNASYHSAAAMNRLTSEWAMMGGASADTVVRTDLRSLRDRARQERRDNPWVARYAQVSRDGILGAHGVTLEPRDGTPPQIKAAWELWCKRYADASGRQTFTQLLATTVEAWKVEGEAFLQIVAQPLSVNPFGVALLALDSDQVDEKYNRSSNREGTEIRMGVEIDRYGRPIRYHVWNYHPDEGGRDKQRVPIPAEQIIHLGRPTRPGQTRFLSPLAPVLTEFRHLRGIQEGVLVLLRTAACKMGFLKPNDQYTGPIEPEQGQQRVQMEAEAGLIDQLPPGFDFVNWDPGQPGPDYAPFVKNVLHAAASGVGMSYGSLSGDRSDATYSSERLDLTLEHDSFRSDTEYVVDAVCAPVYEAWLYWALLGGALRVPAGDATRYPVRWQPRGFDWIDPMKEIQAALLEVAAGANSITRIAAAKGRKLEDIARERSDEIALFQRMGVPMALPSAMTTDAEREADASPPAPPARNRALRVVGDE